VLFAVSCVGLLLFLWISFGGSVPFVAQGYRFSVEFNQAVQLGTQADVDISGVKVGTVVKVGLDRNTGLTKAVIQIDPAYAPRPADTRAILRQKTLLGETYVELSFGNPKGPKLPDGGSLPQGQVSPTVQLDQILNTFDPRTRQAFETWMQDDGIAFTGRGEDFNAAIAELYPFATNVNNVLTVLRRDRAATSTLLADSGKVLAAVSQSPSALQGAITNSNTVFATTAARNAELAAAVKAFPAFLVSTRETIARVERFAVTTKPLIDELKPGAAQLSPALEAVAQVAPALEDLMVSLAPLTAAAHTGVPALQKFLDVGTPSPAGASKGVLVALTPYLKNLDPVITYINSFRREIAGFFANGTASTQAIAQSVNSDNVFLHYLRAASPVGPETLTGYPTRPLSNRSNPYMNPGSDNDTTAGYMTLKNKSLANALQTFGNYLCTVNAVPTLSAALKAALPANVYNAVESVYYGYSYPNPPHPACNQQKPLGRQLGISSAFYPRLQPLP
jgi:phospholipid/cholesterol/gamma-HCH transport system substrate-binding protein